MPDVVIEVCIEGPDAAVAAARGGADRVELCASLLEGGLTPSPGIVRAAVRASGLPVHAMIRPRGGDFLYTDLEFAGMLDDIGAMRAAGAAGVVFGCLRPDGTIDTGRTRALTERARPLPVTFHRAFDMARDPDAALETLIASGIHRVLTSGQQPTAIQGLDVLARLADRAAGRIVVMPCGDLGPESIGAVRRATGLREFHFAALRARPSAMAWRNPAIGMGGTEPEREYRLTETDPDRVRATIAAARSAA